jgi:hypothetical protein
MEASVDPVTGDTTSSDWNSLVLSTNTGDSGYVANADVALGVLVRSNGGIQVFSGGKSLLAQAGFAAPNANGTFDVTVAYTPGQPAATVTVNGVAVTVATPAALPASSSLFMGAYLSNSGEVSTLSDLMVSGVNRTGLTRPASSRAALLRLLRRPADRDSHLAEVAGR